MLYIGTIFLQKELNAPRPSEHPPVKAKKCQKPLHGIQTGSPMVVMLLVIGKQNTFTLYNESTETFYHVYSETVVS